MDFRSITNVTLGENVKIAEFVNLYNCTIGSNTKIGAFVEIQKNAFIGRNCKISSHTFICEGVTIEDNVFIGHGVTFINDKYPKAVTKDGFLQTEQDWSLIPTKIKNGVSIGSGVTIMCGVIIGEQSIIGAGSVVTKNIEPNVIAFGNPAKIIRRINAYNPSPISQSDRSAY